MIKYVQILREVVKDESGQDLVEYGLLIGLIGLASVAAVHPMAAKLANAFSTVGSNITSAT